MLPLFEKIRLIRQAKGWTQEDMAEKLGVSLNAYGDIERCNSDIKLSRLEQIAKVFEVELVELLGVNETSIFNQSYMNMTGTQHNHNYTAGESAELQLKLQNLELTLQLRDKEIELRDEKIRHLTELVELFRPKEKI